MYSKPWTPVQGEEVQVKFPDGYVEICKFINEVGDGNSLVKIGRKQKFSVPNYDIFQNVPAYKKVQDEKDEEKVSRKSRDSDEKDYDW